MDTPFFLLQILIDEDDTRSVRPGKIGVVAGGRMTFEENKLNNEYPAQAHKYDTIYRCGLCGNVVDFNGGIFDSKMRQFKIDILEKYNSTVRKIAVQGDCCHYSISKIWSKKINSQFNFIVVDCL